MHRIQYIIADKLIAFGAFRLPLTCKLVPEKSKIAEPFQKKNSNLFSIKLGNLIILLS